MDLGPLSAALIFLGGFIAGVVNVLAGGGSLITVPLLIFMGVPEVSANGSSRLAILVQGLTASVRFQRAKAIPWALVARFATPVVVGGAIGAMLAVRQSHESFRMVLGWVTLALALVLVINPMAKLNEKARQLPKVVVYAGLFVAGIYGGYVQAGVGYLFLFVGVALAGQDLVTANTLKVLLVLLYTPVALVIFGMSGQVEILPSVLLALGTSVGAYLGAGLALEKSGTWIRWALLATVVLAASKLLLRW